MDNILLETSLHWPFEEIVRFKIEVGVYKKFAKMLQSFHTKITPCSNHLHDVNIIMAKIVLPVARLFCMVWAILACLWEHFNVSLLACCAFIDDRVEIR